MGFLSNPNVNRLNVHASTVRLIEIMRMIFAPLFFYQIGIPLPYVFLILAGINFLRIPFRFTIIPIMRRLGLKNTLIVGAMLNGCAPAILVNATTVNIWVGIYVVVVAFASAIYWTSYHTFYTLSGSKGHRGKHLAVGEALKRFMLAASPYLGAVFIEFQGFPSFFFLVLPLMVLSVLPLLGCESLKVEVSLEGWREELFSFSSKSYFAHSSIMTIQNTCWAFMIFFAMGDISHFGAIITIGLLAQAGFQLVLGYYIDKGHLWRIFTTGILLMAVVIITMSQVSITFISASLLSAAFAFASIYASFSFAVSIYNASHESKHTLCNWIFSEMWSDVAGCIMKGVACSILLLIGVPLNTIILLSLLGVVALYFVMKQRFRP